METVQAIVLKKTPYQDHALIIQCLVPDFGRMDFIVYGAKSVGPKKFPVVDLFRELSVTFRESGDGRLFSASEIELTESFDAIADRPAAWKQASAIGAFLLRNTACAIPSPLVYDVFKNLLRNWTQETDEPPLWSDTVCSVLLKLVFLYENGLLPEPEGDARRVEQLREVYDTLINAGLEFEPLADLSEEYARRLNVYLNSVIRSQNLQWD